MISPLIFFIPALMQVTHLMELEPLVLTVQFTELLTVIVRPLICQQELQADLKEITVNMLARKKTKKQLLSLQLVCQLKAKDTKNKINTFK